MVAGLALSISGWYQLSTEGRGEEKARELLTEANSPPLKRQESSEIRSTRSCASRSLAVQCVLSWLPRS